MSKLVNAFSSIGLRIFYTKDKAFLPLIRIKIEEWQRINGNRIQKSDDLGLYLTFLNIN
jgi:hypothetical protein